MGAVLEIPDDVWIDIFEIAAGPDYLTKEAANLRRVCRRWNVRPRTFCIHETHGSRYFGSVSQELSEPLFYRRFELTLGPGAERAVYNLLHRRIIDKLSSWTWHIVLNNAAERFDAATCILTHAANLRSLQIPGALGARDERAETVSAGVLAAVSSASGGSLERLVICMYKSDYLALAQVGRFHALRTLHIVFVARALGFWVLKDLPGWHLPNLTDVEWIFKRIGAGTGTHNHLEFLARCDFPRVRRLRLALKELAEEHVDNFLQFFAAHPHCDRFEAIFSAPNVVLPLFPHIAARELFIRGVPFLTGAVSLSPAVRHLTIETHIDIGRPRSEFEDFLDALARGEIRGTLETLRLVFLGRISPAQHAIRFAWLDAGDWPKYTAFVTRMRTFALRLEHNGIVLLDEHGMTHELVI
jgi:hypothetical protein